VRLGEGLEDLGIKLRLGKGLRVSAAVFLEGLSKGLEGLGLSAGPKALEDLVRTKVRPGEGWEALDRISARDWSLGSAKVRLGKRLEGLGRTNMRLCNGKQGLGSTKVLFGKRLTGAAESLRLCE
jgi:hypothetical protein